MQEVVTQVDTPGHMISGVHLYRLLLVAPIDETTLALETEALRLFVFGRRGVLERVRSLAVWPQNASRPKDILCHAMSFG